MSDLNKSPVLRKSLADQVSEALIDYIISNNLQDGELLPSTAEIAEQFSVSRTVVREALADLAGRGLLMRSQGRECVVRTPGIDELHQLLRLRAQREGIDPVDILHVREALEVQAARLAAENRTDSDLEEMNVHLQELAEAKRDRAYHQADIAFHRVIAEASGNTLLPLILNSLTPLLYDIRVKATAGRRARGESFEPVIEAHRDILRAIEKQDDQAAGTAMRDHLSQTREGLDAAPAPREKAG